MNFQHEQMGSGLRFRSWGLGLGFMVRGLGLGLGSWDLWLRVRGFRLATGPKGRLHTLMPERYLAVSRGGQYSKNGWGSQLICTL